MIRFFVTILDNVNDVAHENIPVLPRNNTGTS